LLSLPVRVNAANDNEQRDYRNISNSIFHKQLNYMILYFVTYVISARILTRHSARFKKNRAAAKDGSIAPLRFAQNVFFFRTIYL
jgi:hypothetical protein